MSKIITPEGRVSFPKVFEKSEFSGKYECTLVFPKGTDLTELKRAAAAAVKEKFGDKIPLGLKSPFRKVSEKMDTYGDIFDPDDIFIAFRSATRRPGIVDQNVQPIMDQDEFYPGCWARVSAGVYAYNRNGNKGVAFGLNNIQKIRDDDSLSGATKAENDFDRVAGGPDDPDAYSSGDDDIFGGKADDDDMPF